MQPRIETPVMQVPHAMKGLQMLADSAKAGGRA
jgi:hypothetical protein